MREGKGNERSKIFRLGERELVRWIFWVFRESRYMCGFLNLLFIRFWRISRIGNFGLRLVGGG